MIGNLAAHLKQTASIYAEAPIGATPPQTSMGGADRTTRSLVASGVPCLVRPLSALLMAQANRRNDARVDVVVARIYFGADPVAAGLDTRHWIVVDDRTYKVTGVVDPNSLGGIYQVDCEMIVP